MIMKPLISTVLAILILVPSWLHADVTIGVDSPAFVFSPGNWVGDAEREGSQYRQSWNPGAYFRVTWQSDASDQTAKLHFDTSTYSPKVSPPNIDYCLDGVWKINVQCPAELAIPVKETGPHQITVLFDASRGEDRWGSKTASGTSIVRIKDLTVTGDVKAVPGVAGSKWALIIGDSITEGCGASGMTVYSHLLGEALQTQGYEYGISACGWSGWLHGGTGGVPPYYTVWTDNKYHDEQSRWNKIDAQHSLLDSEGHISAYGKTGQQPDLIFMNYGTNDRGKSDLFVQTVPQGLAALRQAAPNAQIILLIPFGQYMKKEILESVEKNRAAHGQDSKLAVIDLGPAEARNLELKGPMGDLHPNPIGHARFAAQIIAKVFTILKP